MKLILIFLFFFILSISHHPLKAKDNKSDISKKEETLKRLTESDLIREKYETCVEAKHSSPWDCVWQKLNPDEKKQVSEILGEFTDNKKEPSESRYENQNLGLFHEKASPVMKKLGDNLFDMFQEAIYGEITKSVKQRELRLVDHAVFYDIYKARISKEFLETVASFCLDSTIDSRRVYKIESDLSALRIVREDNITQLHQNPNKEKDKFNLCITEIRNICTNKKGASGACPKINNKPTACADDEFTKDRACEVQQAVNAIKKNIAATEIIQEEIKKLAEQENGAGSLGGAITGKKVSIYSGAKMDDRQSVDTLTTVTSGQLEEAMKVDDQTNIFGQASEELNQECTSTLSEKCKEYVLDGEEIDEAKNKINEMALRMLAMEERINQNLKESNAGSKKAKEELAQFLKEEGINEEDIETIVEDSAKAKLATDQIIKNYEQRRKAVINNLQNKLNKMVPVDDTDQSKRTVIKKVSEELIDRPVHYQQLVHYSNIVSSYLSTSSVDDNDQASGQSLKVDSQKNSNRYMTAASKELGTLGSSYSDLKDSLSQTIDVEPDEDPDTGKDSLISIGLDTINSFLFKEVIDPKP